MVEGLCWVEVWPRMQNFDLIVPGRALCGVMRVGLCRRLIWVGRLLVLSFRRSL